MTDQDFRDIPMPDAALGRVIPDTVSILQMEQERRRHAELKNDLYFVGGLLGTLAGTILGWLLGKYF